MDVIEVFMAFSKWIEYRSTINPGSNSGTGQGNQQVPGSVYHRTDGHKIKRLWQQQRKRNRHTNSGRNTVKECSPSRIRLCSRARHRHKRTGVFCVCRVTMPRSVNISSHFLTLRDKTTGEVTHIHNAPFHNAAAAKVKGTPNLKAVFMWPRGHAKSTHMDIFVPLWLMFQPKRLINFMVVVGKSEDSATRLLGDIQAELEHNQRIIAELRPAGECLLAGWGVQGGRRGEGVASGRGQSPRGLRDREARPDYIVIDDLDDDELCRNEKRVHDITDWVKEAFGALDVGRGRYHGREPHF